MSEIQGADVLGLKSAMEDLISQSYPVHPHYNRALKTPLLDTKEHIHFKQANLPAVLKKLKLILAEISLSNLEETTLDNLVSALERPNNVLPTQWFLLIGTHPIEKKVLNL